LHHLRHANRFNSFGVELNKTETAELERGHARDASLNSPRRSDCAFEQIGNDSCVLPDAKKKWAWRPGAQLLLAYVFLAVMACTLYLAVFYFSRTFTWFALLILQTAFFIVMIRQIGWHISLVFAMLFATWIAFSTCPF
jgi:hypothetical protein